MEKRYICNGKRFGNIKEVREYLKTIDCRITNTQTIRYNRKSYYLVDIHAN